MKGRGQLVMGGLAGLLVGAGIGGIGGFNKGYDAGYNEAHSKAEGIRIIYGSSQYAKGLKKGREERTQLVAQPGTIAYTQEELEKLFEEKITEGRRMQFMPSQTAGPYFMRNSETGQLKYARFDILFGGQSFDDYLNSRMPPSSVIIMSDLREVREVGPDMDKLHGKAYLDMLWRGAVPAVILTTEENKKVWDTNDEAQRLVEQYLPPHTSYQIRIVPKEVFEGIDPWQHIEKDTPFRGIYHPNSIGYSVQNQP